MANSTSNPTETYGITALRMDDILHLKRVKIGKVIGMGAFGTMLRVTHGEEEYAAKRMNESLLVEKFTLRSLKDFCRKCVPIFNLKRTSSGVDNVVKYIGIYQDDPNAMPLLVMELMHIDLRYLLHVHKDTITFRDEVNIAHDIATGLDFLHSQVPEILHRNLHANNILLDSSFRAKIADLMNVKLIPPEYILKKEITSIPGHEEYLPPEIFRDVRSYTASSDVFSLGVLILEILTRKAPRPVRNLKQPEVQRRKSDLSLVAEDNVLLRIVYSCIKDHESERPSAKEVSDNLAEIKETLQYAVCASVGGVQVSVCVCVCKRTHNVHKHNAYVRVHPYCGSDTLLVGCMTIGNTPAPDDHVLETKGSFARHYIMLTILIILFCRNTY